MPKLTKTPKLISAYMGIDPGKSGGIAVLYKNGSSQAFAAIPMPATEADIWHVINRLANTVTIDGCYIEKVQGYIGEGSEAPGRSMFNFGHNYGNLRMALIGNKIPFEEVTPQAWQKAIHIPPRKKKGRKFVETRTQWKNRLKAKAQQLFPEVAVTLKTADALLIALYCKRQAGL